MKVTQGTKTSQELADIVLNLDPSWNRLEVELEDCEQEQRISTLPEDASLAHGFTPPNYTHLTETYQFSSTLFPWQEKAIPQSTIQTYNGSPKIGEAYKPLQIQLRVDGHSYLRSEERHKWPAYLTQIQERIQDLLTKGYTLKKVFSLKNQQDDFPGNIDAEEQIEYTAINSEE